MKCYSKMLLPALGVLPCGALLLWACIVVRRSADFPRLASVLCLDLTRQSNPHLKQQGKKKKKKKKKNKIKKKKKKKKKTKLKKNISIS